MNLANPGLRAPRPDEDARLPEEEAGRGAEVYTPIVTSFLPLSGVSFIPGLSRED